MPQSQPRPYWILYLAMMAIGMGQTIIFAVMPMLGRELGLHEISFSLPLLDTVFYPRELAITSLSAITALVFSMVSPIWGRISDRVGRKPIIVLGLVGYTVGMTVFNGAAALGLYGVLSGVALYSLLLLTRILHASIMSASIPASNAYIADVTTAESRSKGLSKLNAASQLGILCGPALTALIAISYLAPFIFQSVLTLLLGIALWFFLPESNKRNQRPAMKKLRLMDPRFRLYIAISLLLYIAMGMVQQTLGFYFQDILSVSNEKAAQLFSLAMIASSAGMMFSQLVLVQRLSYSPQQFIILGLPIMAIGFAVIAWATGLLSLIAGMGLFGLAMGMVGPSLAAAASLEVEAFEQGGLAGLMSSMAGIGFVIGPLLGGFLYGFESSYPYILASLTVALAGVFAFIAIRPKIIS